jgi:hypothetical protein
VDTVKLKFGFGIHQFCAIFEMAVGRLHTAHCGHCSPAAPQSSASTLAALPPLFTRSFQLQQLLIPFGFEHPAYTASVHVPSNHQAA